MENHHRKRVEDYTNANLVLILVNLLWIFGVVWAHVGIGGVLILGAVLNHMIARLEASRARRNALPDHSGAPDAQGCNLTGDSG